MLRAIVDQSHSTGIQKLEIGVTKEETLGDKKAWYSASSDLESSGSSGNRCHYKIE